MTEAVWGSCCGQCGSWSLLPLRRCDPTPLPACLWAPRCTDLSLLRSFLVLRGCHLDVKALALHVLCSCVMVILCLLAEAQANA